MTVFKERYRRVGRRGALPHPQNKGKAGDGTRVTIDAKLSVVPGAPNAPKSCLVNVEWVSAG